MPDIQALEIDLTQRYDNLSNDQTLQYRFYCDECGDPVETQERLLGDVPADALKLIEMDARKWLEHCPYCVKWVCANCYHAFRGMCEVCAQLPPEQLVRKTSKDETPVDFSLEEVDQDVSYSSILGAVCVECQYPLKEGATHCSSCGHEIPPDLVWDTEDPNEEGKNALDNPPPLAS